MRRPSAAFLRARFASAPPAPRASAPLADAEARPSIVSPDVEPDLGTADPRHEGPFIRNRLVGRVVTALMLVGILAVGLYVRLRHNGYGLPYVYNFDEATHFTHRAVTMLGSSLNPRYFQNPSGFTYSIYVALHVVYGLLGVHLPHGSVIHQFNADATPIWKLTRGVAAVLATLGVGATFFVGRRLWGTAVGLVAAAILGFAFLSVTYSRIAVTDVGTFLPVALAIFGIVRVHERGWRRDYILAGAATGLAIGFKYTAGVLVLPLILAGGLRLWREQGSFLRRPGVLGLVLSGVAVVVAFGITTPYFFIHPVSALYQIRSQEKVASGISKLGQSQEGGYIYYLKSFTWGFGWAAIVAAITGVVLELRRDRARGLLLIVFPIAMYLYLGAQSRYFGRWMLPMYPVLALLAGVAIVRVAHLIKGRPLVAGAACTLLAAAVLIQPVAADFRTAAVLGREDTRQVARDYLVRHYRPGLRVVVEPGVPDNFYGVPPNFRRRKQFVRGFIRDIHREANATAAVGTTSSYANTLRPELIDAYRRTGFCLAVTMSVIRGRAEAARLPGSLAYYARLERESTQVLHASPFNKGRRPVPLHYDFSYDYYPTAYHRPGPDVRVYRLHNCRQGYGRVPTHAAGTTGLDKGRATSFLQGGK